MRSITSVDKKDKESLLSEARLGDKNRARAERHFSGTEKEGWVRGHTQRTVAQTEGLQE